MMEDRFLKRLRKKARKGLRGWPIATIAFYGPNLSQARSLRKVVSWLSSPTRPTGLGVLELSEAGSAWPSTAAPDRGLGRPVAGEVELDQGCKPSTDTPSEARRGRHRDRTGWLGM